MLFNSPIFLFLFLPSLLLLHPAVPRTLKNPTLLVYSLFFYYWGSGHLLVLLLLSIASNYFYGLRLGASPSSLKRKAWMALAVATNLGLLFYFKYTDFLIGELNRLFASLNLAAIPQSNILLPIGISFFTFQALSYIIDLYRGSIQVQRNPLDFALYISLFPQLVAGPIVRYIQIAGELHERETSPHHYYLGLGRFIIGLGKKVIIADQLAGVVDTVMALPPNELTFPAAWIGTFFFALQIYYDFSGYTDMAIGLGRVFGFNFPENFNYPYIARSITEFWRRWHISLSTWFRDYLYIPLGGNRNGPYRTYANLFIVFVLCGLWHGANWNFLIWGLMHGAFLVAERLMRGRVNLNVPSAFKHLYVIIVLCLTWVFFRIPEFGSAFSYIRAMASFDLSAQAWQGAAELLNPEIMLYFALAVVFSMPVKDLLKKVTSLSALRDRKPLQAEFAQMGLILLVFIYTMLVFASSSYKTYIYFKF